MAIEHKCGIERIDEEVEGQTFADGRHTSVVAKMLFEIY